MKTLLWTLVFSLATLTSAAAEPVATERRLSLDEAIALALEKNDALVIEREGLAAATAAVSGAEGAYDQVLELTGSWQRSKDPAELFPGTTPSWIVPDQRSSGMRLAVRQLLPTGGALSVRAMGERETRDGTVSSVSPAYGTQVGAELRQPLLRNRAIDGARLSVRVAAAGREGARASLRRSVTETVAAVERAYWTLVAARLGVGVREEAVRLAEEQLGETRTRVASGTVPGTELAQPRAELERRRGELFAGREALARAENGLKLLILADGDAAWTAVIAPAETVKVDMVSVDVPAFLDHALATRPELELAQAAARRRHAESSFAGDAVRPSLDAVVSYDRFGLAGSGGALQPQFRGRFGESFESLGDGDLHATRLALVLALPVRNRPASAEAAVARHVERQADAEIGRIRKAIRAEVLDAAAGLTTAAQRIEAARSGREAAEVQLSAERERYESGLSTNFLVLTRQNDLSRARLDEISALTGYRIARTEMARAIGTLAGERGIEPGEAR